MDTITIKNAGNIINHWWLMLSAGLLLICLGIWVISSPFQSYLSLSYAFAIGMIWAGVFELVFSIVNHKAMKSWGWALAGSMLDIFIGVYLFYYPLITMVILPLIIGFWILFRGIMAIGSALDIRSHGFWDWRWLLSTGIVIILLAIMILTNPDFGIFNIIVWTGLGFILSGIFRMYFALKLRNLHNHI